MLKRQVDQCLLSYKLWNRTWGSWPGSSAGKLCSKSLTSASLRNGNGSICTVEQL